jgi:ATP-dependent RNA helicase RhlE
LLRQDGMDSVLIFTRTKIFADRLTRSLTERGFRVSVMHGDRSQSQRLRALDQFRRGRNSIMVATDIAARGIDIEDISHVVNYDVPHTPEDYVHRIGRTARAEATGDAVTLVDASEELFITDIERALGRQIPRITLPNFDYGPAAPPAGTRHGGRPHGGGPPRHGHHGGPGPHGHGAPGGPNQPGGDRRRRRRRGRGGGHGGHGHGPQPAGHSH